MIIPSHHLFAGLFPSKEKHKHQKTAFSAYSLETQKTLAHKPSNLICSSIPKATCITPPDRNLLEQAVCSHPHPYDTACTDCHRTLESLLNLNRSNRVDTCQKTNRDGSLDQCFTVSFKHLLDLDPAAEVLGSNIENGNVCIKPLLRRNNCWNK